MDPRRLILSKHRDINTRGHELAWILRKCGKIGKAASTSRNNVRPFVRVPAARGLSHSSRAARPFPSAVSILLLCLKLAVDRSAGRGKVDLDGRNFRPRTCQIAESAASLPRPYAGLREREREDS